jgi:hypothetical protein
MGSAPTGAEIQSVALRRGSSEGFALLGAAAADGSAFLLKVNGENNQGDLAETIALSAQTSKAFGWAGIAFDPLSASVRLAVCHERARNVQVMDGDAPLRRMPLAMPASSLCWASVGSGGGKGTAIAASVLLATSADRVVVGDLRERGDASGWTRQIQPARGDSLGALAVGGAADTNVLLCTGSSGAVYVYDVRTWRVRRRWAAPVKHAVTSLLVPPNGPRDAVYAVGSDHELVGSGPNWGAHIARGRSRLSLAHTHGFRAASRWVGAEVVGGGAGEDEVVLSACVGGELYRIAGAKGLQLPQA